MIQMTSEFRFSDRIYSQLTCFVKIDQKKSKTDEKENREEDRSL